MRTANPTLNDKIFTTAAQDYTTTETMTVGGTVNKTAILLLLLLISAVFTWRMFYTSGFQAVMPWMFGGLIGGFILAIVTIFAKRWAMITAPMYALAEGLFLGGISSYFETLYPNIVIQAVGLTFGTLILILMIYKTGIIKVTDKFRIGIIAATGAIALVYIVTLVLNMFGSTVPYIHGNGWIGIGFSLLVIGIARSIWCWISISLREVPRLEHRNTWNGTVRSDLW